MDRGRGFVKGAIRVPTGSSGRYRCRPLPLVSISKVQIAEERPSGAKQAAEKRAEFDFASERNFAGAEAPTIILGGLRHD